MATYAWKTDKRGNRHFVRTADAVTPKAKPEVPAPAEAAPPKRTLTDAQKAALAAGRAKKAAEKAASGG